MVESRELRVRVGAVAVLVALLEAGARGQVFQYSLTGEANTGFGMAVSRVGDVDGDGVDDFIEGAPYAGANDKGVAKIFSGATGAELVKLVGARDWALFGASVDGRIDLDGDGYHDVLVGAPLDAYSNGGTVLAYSPHLQTQLYLLTGDPGAALGSSVRSLQADLDGDGIADFIVGAPSLTDAVNPMAFVYSGKDGSLLFKKSGQSGSHFGAAVSRGGDMDGDGVCDFLVGAPDHTDPTLGTLGRVTAFSGRTGNKLWSFDGLNVDSKLGFAVAQPGDFDQDGAADCVVGAPKDLDASGNSTGSVLAISGATGTLIYELTGDSISDFFGYDVRGVGGDVNGDGSNDFIVGAPSESGDPGYARVFSGPDGAVLHTYLEHTSDPSGAPAYYGSAVAGGDFNGDGRTDVVIGDGFFDGTKGLVEIWDTAVASWHNYDKGYPGTFGVPSLTASANPVVGQPLDVLLGNSAGADSSALLLIGVAKANFQTRKGGTLLVDPLIVLPLALPAAGLTFSGSVPDDPALEGIDAYLQAIEIDAGASGGLSFTAGLDLFFGFP